MNENHAQLCASAEWAEYLQTEVLAPLVAGRDLGHRMVEVGPGYGATTDWLRSRVAELVAVETEPDTVMGLRQRFADGNVEVVEGDAAALGYAEATFDSAGTFTMLHHVPTREGQRAVISELVRVLRPGGVLVGSDSLASDRLRQFHEGDVYNPLPPPELLGWLQELGCRPVMVAVGDVLTFAATKPRPQDSA